MYETRGFYPQAIEEVTQAVNLSGGDPYYTAGLGHALGTSGHTAEADQILRTLLDKSSHQYVPAFAVAMVYLGVRENRATLAWLGKATRDYSTSIAYLKVDPFLHGLASDPKFLELSRRLAF